MTLIAWTSKASNIFILQRQFIDLTMLQFTSRFNWRVSFYYFSFTQRSLKIVLEWLLLKCAVLFTVFEFQQNFNSFYVFVSANEFPSSFESIVRKILRLLFHVVAHLYHCHFREVLLLNLHAHLNCVFVHLTLFNERFRLIEPRETEILDDLVVALKILATEPSETEQVGLVETIDIQ